MTPTRVDHTGRSPRRGPNRRRGHLLAALVVVTAALSLAAPDPAAAEETSRVRLAHFSPDTAEVDVYVDDASGTQIPVLTGLGYGEISDYMPLPAGEHTFLLRAAGAEATSPPLATASATLTGGAAQTFAAMGPRADLQPALVTDDLTAPPPGEAKVRLIQASDGAGQVDVTTVDGPVLAESITFGATTRYTAVDPGEWTVTVTADSGDVVTRRLELEAGTVSSLVVLESTGGDPFELTRVVDGTGVDASDVPDDGSPGTVAATPLGGVAAGAGGATSGPADDSDLSPVVVGVALAVVAALAFGGIRLVRAHAPAAAGDAGRHPDDAPPQGRHLARRRRGRVRGGMNGTEGTTASRRSV